MAICRSCGMQVDDGAKFCPLCGALMDEQPPQQAQYTQQGYTPPVIPGAPTQNDIRDAQDNKAMAVLSYIFFFVPLLAGAHKTSPFVKYHANQGTVLFLAAAAVSIVLSILFSIFTGIFVSTLAWGALTAIATISGIIWLVYSIAILVLVILGILNAVNGRCKQLPIIGRFTIIK